jgi:hypothetical protein
MAYPLEEQSQSSLALVRDHNRETWLAKKRIDV